MALKVLEVNISKSMDCTIEFNGAVGFEVKKGLCQHKMDIARRTCSYRVWQLRGILCAHVVDALYFKKFYLYDSIDSCYSKETYLRIYANVIEPLTNMEMWPVSTNPTIEPPEITNMPAPSAPSLPTAFPASFSAPPTYHASSSIVGTTKRERGRGRGNTSPEKRPRVMGMGVFQAANGFKVMNVKPSMPSSKIYSAGQAKVTRSSDVTSDIGYTPSNTTKLKWNGVLTYVVLVMCFTNGVVLSMLKYEWMTRLLVVDEVLHINTSFN
ncbi:hypothetical protein MTR67_020063 [Solanum verrucosum]|uniref:SWIM-type domain-containing protein n=1 Tax=Solanum verrucosum TaxID=315347 RepID=A0AAF0TVF4_SOLVR|nr:hypothetical protein MTR67_020063 [Solanum verrucosum]